MSRLQNFVLHCGGHNYAKSPHPVPTAHFLKEHVPVCHIMVYPSLLCHRLVLLQAKSPCGLAKTVFPLLLPPFLCVDAIDNAFAGLLFHHSILAGHHGDRTNIGCPTKSISQLIHLAREVLNDEVVLPHQLLQA